ncbi:bZIP transcription factor-like protein [Aaosphaeria arxii CBS 175.79]|uniref:BZIP transcription factor-like protein n=1 Tax=Aaosphaeria arxii CBS 175.79 TaxID=1450172 RepID=A0A6A5XLV5_9PLEO|nr:bZIP transcription factor-like protein [Aaosphaeria arxii CBS 175.79]KAF2013807.1 bZIP transcription factor-like protein [Aaosphaeria arxii CBS 175.79]
MSAYNGRRGPNVSRYVADLNNNSALTSTFDPLEAPANLDDDLAVFANSDFIDWNGGSEGGFNPNASLDFHFNLDEKPNHFDVQCNFEFADFSTFPNHIVDTSMQSVPQVGHYPINHNFNSPVSAVSPVTPGFDHSTGTKRKSEHIDEQGEPALDEAARVAAEEDKRRRNTAASARFRVKKKQREQALEKTAKEMSDRVSVLETRIQQLETENTWLKGLITEKNNGKASSKEVSAMLKKHIEENSSERSRDTHTDGVGTKSEDN